MSEQVFQPLLRPELPKTPEQQLEQPKINTTEQKAPTQDIMSPVSATSNVQAAILPKDKDPQLVEIESILADGLDQAYMSLTAEKRQEFRSAGEVLARTIQEMVQHGKVNMKKIRNLIIKWLRVIPGVNRYFLEQEAKIKADRLTEIGLDR